MTCVPLTSHNIDYPPVNQVESTPQLIMLKGSQEVCTTICIYYGYLYWQSLGPEATLVFELQQSKETSYGGDEGEN